MASSAKQNRQYTALIDGLSACAKHTNGNVKHIIDSKLVAGQLGLGWKVNKPNLRPLHAKANRARALFKLVAHCWVKREDGRIREADAMVNKSLDAVYL